MKTFGCTEAGKAGSLIGVLSPAASLVDNDKRWCKDHVTETSTT